MELNKKFVMTVVEKEICKECSCARTWLDGAEIIHLTRNEVIFYIKNDVSREEIKRRFPGKIQSVFQEYYGLDNIKVTFVGMDQLLPLGTTKQNCTEDPVKDAVMTRKENLIAAFRDVRQAIERVIDQLDQIIDSVDDNYNEFE